MRSVGPSIGVASSAGGKSVRGARADARIVKRVMGIGFDSHPSSEDVGALTNAAQSIPFHRVGPDLGKCSRWLSS